MLPRPGTIKLVQLGIIQAFLKFPLPGQRVLVGPIIALGNLPSKTRNSEDDRIPSDLYMSSS